MEVVKKPGCTSIILDIEEVKILCRPGAGADTCIWLCVGPAGFECLYYKGDVPNLMGETLRERWQRGDTVGKRDGCEEIGKIDLR